MSVGRTSVDLPISTFGNWIWPGPMGIRGYSGSGLVTSTPPGLSCGTTCSAPFPDGDPVTRGGDARFRQRIPGSRGQPHTTLRGGHFIQEDDPQSFARLAIEACGRRSGAPS